MCRKRCSTFISLTAVECVHWTHGIKIERNNLLCEQAPTEVFRSIFAWLVTFNLLPVLILQSRLHESLKQRMRSVGSGLELRVSLGGYEEGMLGKLAHLHDTSVRGQSGQTQTVFSEDGTIIVVDLVTMTMSFRDVLLSVELVSTGSFIQYTRVCTQS